ncbi:hypothetical protein LOZ80_38810 [Paenibacillus sp. HWE-109]|nr:hypothetical protein [Paenibacillus sp. HWE-109]UKS27320.1 hypothetical protein LOZ80_38810 [Paenibacillus sp. HWE-109]
MCQHADAWLEEANKLKGLLAFLVKVIYKIANDLYDKGHIDAQNLRPVSRLAGNSYAKLGDQFEIERPI